MMCGAAIKDVFLDTRSIPEPAGALAVAGIKTYIEQHEETGNPLENMTMVAVTSGANMNFDRLRFVAERADVGENREAVLAVTIPEERGSFRRFCELIGPRHVTEFNYRISDDKAAHVFVGIEVKNRKEKNEIIATFENSRYRTIDLSDDELGKLHIRYMVGGKSPFAENELLYRFEFPERPGRPDALSFINGAELEHQPFPLPEPRRGLRAGTCRTASTATGHESV